MITNQFIFIHIPKTGGTFIRNFIKNKNFNIINNEIHLTIKQSENYISNVPSFCFVRNPWDFYVSRFFYRQKILTKNNGINGFIPLELTGGNKQGFKKHIIMLDELFENNLETKSKCRALKIINIEKIYEIFTENRTTYIGYFENFKNDLFNIFSKILNTPIKIPNNKENESKHEIYSKYYDDELIKIIEKWDKNYIKKFNYKFGAE